MKIIRNKKGVEYLYMYIFYTIFMILMLGILINWTYEISKNEDFKRKVISKQTALILDAAEPEIMIEFQTENISMTLENGKVFTKKTLKFEYPFYSPYQNLLKQKGEEYSLKIL